MSTSNILGIVGAGIGFIVSGGNPLGAQIGFTIGSAVGSAIDPVTIKAPGLSEAPSQTSNDGVPRPMVWGLHGGIHGNIIQKNPETQVTTTESQGKGGGPEVEETRRFRTFAIRVCEGPIAEITRIFRNGTLVYDVRETPAIPVEETAKFAEGIRIYKGDEAQLPDSELEAHWGDDTPAYRGTCYVVFVNHDLTEVGGAIPQFAFEVNGSKDHTITSQPYPVEAIDGIDQIAAVDSFDTRFWPLEGVLHTVAITSISIAAPLKSATYPTEGVDQGAAVTEILLETVLKEYQGPIEGIDQTVSITSITLANGLIEYIYLPEGIDQTAAITGITLT